MLGLRMMRRLSTIYMFSMGIEAAAYACSSAYTLGLIDGHLEDISTLLHLLQEKCDIHQTSIGLLSKLRIFFNGGDIVTADGETTEDVLEKVVESIQDTAASVIS